MRWLYQTLAVLIALVFTGAPTEVRPQGSNGDEFTFVRVKYKSGGENFRLRNTFGHPYWSSWTVDYPTAEENFMRGLKKVTTLHVADKAVALNITDPEFFRYPFAYILEVGYMVLTPAEADSLREWLLRGGFLMVDDFHGPYEWEHFENQMRVVFPDREIVEIEPDHPIFHCYYDFENVPQVPGLGSVFRDRTYEKGGTRVHCRGIYDDDGRLMVLINFNTDLGDSWEHAQDWRYPTQFSVAGFRLGINFVIYALTH